MESDKSSPYEIHRIKSPALQLAIIITGVFMAFLDTTIVNVAIPHLESDLGAKINQVQWVVTVYMLVLGMLIPISGWLTDKLGAKRLFLSALVIFTLGSAFAGLAWNLEAVIGFRIIQAIGGAFMQPVAMSMIYRTYPPERRGTIMGVYGLAIMAAPAFGPALGGYLVEYLSWRFVFYINVPIGIAAWLVGVFKMHEFSHESRGKFDLIGFVCAVVGLGSLLYGFSKAATDGWNSAEVETFLGIGIAFIVLLVIVELKIANPMIQLKVFRNYMFTMSLIIISLFFTAFFSGIFFLSQYLQIIQSYSPMRAGLFMTPAALTSAVLMLLSGRLFNRIGARPLAVVGLIIMTVATYGFTKLTVDTSSSTIQWLYILRSAGMGLVLTPVITAGMNTVPFELTSQATAMSNTTRQVATSLGTALLTTYLTARIQYHAVHATGQLTKSRIFTQGLDDMFVVASALTGTALILALFYANKKETAARRQNRLKKKSGRLKKKV